jgi:hypothetical protein
MVEVLVNFDHHYTRRNGMSGKSSLKNVLAAIIPKMVSGLTKHYAGQSLVLNNTTMTAEEVIAALNALPSAVAAAEEAVTVAKTQTATADATADTVSVLMTALHGAIFSRFGNANAAVEDFGMTPKKTRTRTVASKAEQVAKSLATRAERHTLGSRQKAAIHGTVPAAAPATPTTPTAPAATAANNPGGNAPKSGV